MTVRECFDKGLLRKGTPRQDIARKELSQAEFFIKEAEELLEMDKDIIATIPLYQAFFHSAKALLFRDGMTERSHWCVTLYLKERYVKQGRVDGKLLRDYETAMALRHRVLYSSDPVHIEEDLSELADSCREFIAAARALCA